MHLRTEVTRQHGSESDLIQLGPLKKTDPRQLAAGGFVWDGQNTQPRLPG